MSVHTVASRAALAVALAVLPQARPQGFGAAATAGLTGSRAAVAAGIGALTLLMLPGGLWALAALTLTVAGMGALARRQIGGLTGDVLGAMQVTGELAVLMALAA